MAGASLSFWIADAGQGHRAQEGRGSLPALRSCTPLPFGQPSKSRKKAYQADTDSEPGRRVGMLFSALRAPPT